MARGSLEQFLEEMQAEFLSGNLRALTRRFSEPLVVYSLAGVAVFRTREDLAARTKQYREAVLALNVVSSDVTIVSRDAVLNNRLRATVRIVDYDADGRAATGSLIRYFLIETDASYQVEMVEYLETPLPPEDVERLVH